MRTTRRILLPAILSLALTTTAWGESFATRAGYPPKALREGREGTVQITLEIDERGRPASCTVSMSSGWPDLDESACEQTMARAKFNPATDAAGKPARGTFTGKIAFKIPR